MRRSLLPLRSLLATAAEHSMRTVTIVAARSLPRVEKVADENSH
jgi:hypothetical protein